MPLPLLPLLAAVFVFPLVAARADEPVAKPEPTAEASPATGATQGEAWRFKRHNNQWWYWLPTEKWVVWDGQAWVPYERRVQTTDVAPRRQRSYAYPPQQGNWGPVRYDRWGNRQYPYSRRTSGLQQLGPVPAMGGVRSLPGWGGER